MVISFIHTDEIRQTVETTLYRGFRDAAAVRKYKYAGIITSPAVDIFYYSASGIFHKEPAEIVTAYIYASAQIIYFYVPGIIVVDI